MKFRTYLLTIPMILAMDAPSAQAGLDLGDKAPKLYISEWVRGDKVEFPGDLGKKLYLVEFWATWCGPCKVSIPLLTDYQKQFKNDLTIIGVTEPDFAANSATIIKRFVKKQGGKMAYTVAMDKGGKTSRAYMMAAGIDGIPYAFLVGRDSKIMWHGSPLDPSLADVLAKAVSGTYDITSAMTERKVLKKLETVDYAWRMGDWATVREGLKEVLQIDPANDVALGGMMHILVNELNDPAAMRSWIRAHITNHKQDAQTMERVAYLLCTVEDLAIRTPDLAIQAGRAAFEASKKRSASSIAIYAYSLYLIGDLEQAMSLQQDALAVASEAQRPNIKGTLDYYRQCQELRSSLKP